jgi:hypothetical protein
VEERKTVEEERKKVEEGRKKVEEERKRVEEERKTAGVDCKIEWGHRNSVEELRKIAGEVRNWTLASWEP